MVSTRNKAETTLLKFPEDLGSANYKDIRDSTDIVLIIPFSSECKSMGCVVQLPDGVHRLFMKGASKILTQKSSRYVIVHCDGASIVPGGSGIETGPIGELEEDNISCTITFYTSQTLRTVALCYHNFRSWPPKGGRIMDDGEVLISFVV